MKLFEYQAKEIFKSVGIAIPRGILIAEDEEFGDINLPCVIKSQVMQGGRGKAGLIQFADKANEAREKASALRFGPAKVKKILIEEKLNIKQEIYLAITIDPVDCSALIMASSEGGMDIEELAKTMPGKIIREEVAAFRELEPYQLRNVMFALGLKGDAFKQGCKILMQMFKAFRQYDAELVEINPLVITDDEQVIAADGKFIIDDNAAFRQQSYPLTRDQFDSDIEFEAAREGIPYLQFDGDIGLMCAGAGLTNAIYDLVNYFGGKVANYLEFGGPNYRRAVEAMEFTLRNKPKVILIVTFGTIARADVMAQGIADAVKKLKPEIPIVTAIRGTGEDEAGEILRKIGFENLSETEDAVKRAVALAKGDK
ncbi:MAG: succinate--CoA ligase subunit beta [Victivallaceae bacterium]|nr:succinate--CoA ligase subunit beta [Victivallaceae bacterium]